MIKQLKAITTNLVAAANVVTGAAMWLVGFSDYAHPADHPYLATVGLLFPLFLAANLGFLFFWLMFKKRMAIIPIAAYAAAFVPLRIYMPINVSEEPPDGSIKVLSYNVRTYADPSGKKDCFEEIIRYLRNSDADIVCLQEDLYGKHDAKLRYDSIFAYSDTTYVGITEKKRNAVGIYSRFPILRKERIQYTSEGNGSVAYYLKIDADTVIVINNHFESSHLLPDERQRYKDMLKGKMEQDTARAESKRLLSKLGASSSIRASQVDSVYNYIRSHSGYPIILCGDFNDSPISYTRRMMAKDLTDCYVATGRGIGVSYNQKGFFVRIDNMMCSKHFTPYGCTVDNKIAASDHYPIYCWLKMQ